MKKMVLFLVLFLFSVAVVSAVSCGDTIVANTNLTGDLGPCAGDGLTVGASGITIDCQGNSIIGSGSGTGMNINNNFVTVRNCTFLNFTYGINLAGSNSIIDSVTVSGAGSGYGIYSATTNCDNNNITNVTGINREYGVYLYYDCDNNYIADNNFSNNNYGIYIQGHGSAESYSDNNRIINNDVSNANNWGIASGLRTTNTTVSGNDYTNDANGLLLSNPNNVFRDLDFSIYNIDGTVIQLSGDSNVVDNVTVSGMGSGYGIELYAYSSNNNITNVTSTNRERGISIYFGGDNNYVADCNLSNNDYGVYIQGHSGSQIYCENNRIINNDVSNANNWGVYSDFYTGNTTLSGNDYTNDANGILVGHNTRIRDLDLTSFGVTGTGVQLSGDSNVVDNVTVSGMGSGYGIYVSGASSNNNITNVTSVNREKGIYINYAGDNNYVADCNLSNNDYGVYIQGHSGSQLYCENNRIVNSDLSDANLWGVYSDFYTRNTTLSGNDYTNDANGIAIGSNATIRDVDFSAFGITGTSIHLLGNYNIIDNVDVSGSGSGYGIYTSSGGCDNNNITNITAINREYGVYLYYDCDNNYIADSYFSNSAYGVYVVGHPSVELYCDNNKIVDNDFINLSEWAIYAGIRITNLTITDNTIADNANGTYLSSYADDSTVYHNNIYNNTGAGVSSVNAIELSYNNEGNFWGHTSLPYFTAGVDTNAVDVIDSYPFSALDGWAADSDGDGVLDGSDNCVNDANPDQFNQDNDSSGDVCDICPADATDSCNPNEQASKTIDETGGTVQTGNGEAAVSIPASAVPFDTTVSITNESEGYSVAFGEETLTVLSAYMFKTSVETFNKPVTITMSYGQGSYVECPGNEAELGIFRYNETSGEWEAQNAVQDCGANTLSVNTTSFSNWAILGPQQQQQEGVIPEFSSSGKIIVSVIALVVVAIVASMLMKKKQE